eukprot:TRINITY_DN6459_c0_g1_i2.p1 TRINITY_DN6459_c0_g1~~TRINITY_DN6459_c0_g1_i2.p1  ORF type:complete len:227 (+),score=59.74 TRINITY_DN6459_c0_g1_i2:332-1012(+)
MYRSVAEMCGNGIRCVAYFLYRFGYVEADGDLDDVTFSVETLSGVVTPTLHLNHPWNVEDTVYVSVDMGVVEPLEELDIRVFSEGEVFSFTGQKVDAGVPHFVIKLEDASEMDDRLVKELGSKIEKKKEFPKGTNVDFIYVEDEDNITMRVWERGAGETMSCGSGACAVGRLAFDHQWTGKNKVHVNLYGGTLIITKTDDNHIVKTGAASYIKSLGISELVNKENH